MKFALNTGNLPLGGLLRISVARISDCPYMTKAVDTEFAGVNLKSNITQYSW